MLPGEFKGDTRETESLLGLTVTEMLDATVTWTMPCKLFLADQQIAA